MAGRRLFFGAGLAVAVLLSGCATSPELHAREGAALTAAANTVGNAADGLKIAAQTGQVKGPAAAKASDTLTKAGAAIHAGKDAYDKGDDADAATNAATAADLLAQLIVIITGAPQ